MNFKGTDFFIRMSGSYSIYSFFRFTFSILLFSGFFSFSLPAAYLKNVPRVITQPDGSIVNCFSTGDEYHNWLHDAGNFTIIQDPVTGYFVYAVKQDGILRASSFIAGKDDPSRLGLQSGLNLDEQEVRLRRKELPRLPALKGTTGAMTTGTINNIVIFIRFSDQSEYTEPVAKYNLAFNSAGSVSMVDYFREISGSRLTINTTLFPGTGGATVVSYQDTRSRSYYCRYNAVTNPSGYQNTTERSEREMSLLKDATESLKSQIESTGLNYDNDGNGQVDNVCYIVQGATDVWAELLWPHMWALYAHDVSIGGARVWNYNLQMTETFSVGVLCHEMAHSLGFPDLYRYSNNTYNPVGPWDIMSGITNPPQHPGIYLKHKYGGWISGIPEITADGTYSLKPLSSDPLAGYRINSPNSSTEYFVIEYRKEAGMYEAGLLGSGLIICRVDPAQNGNCYGPPDEVYLFRPDGTTTLDGSLLQANFSSDAGRTVFGGSGNPACFLSDGSPGGFRITNIGTAGETISFTVTFGDNVPAELKVEPTSRNMEAGAFTTSFSVSNAGEGIMQWNAAVTDGGDWIRLTSGSSGTNSGSIIVSGDANTGNSARTAMITVTAANAGGSPGTITINQAGNPSVLNVVPDSRWIGSSSGTTSFEVSNTGGGSMNWSATVTSGESWIHILSGGSGTNQGTIVVSADENTGTSRRSGRITITPADERIPPKMVYLYQDEGRSELSVSPVSAAIGFEAATASFEVSNPGSGHLHWSAAVTAGESWIRIVSGEIGTDAGRIQVSVDANPDDQIREAIIMVSNLDNDDSPETLRITQAASKPVLNFSPAVQNISSAGEVPFSPYRTPEEEP
jgi:M6 family metalloprotease-like protein